ncbi:MAG: ATP-binding protein [Burkholderiales bacterium]|nr:ATP-binding protein [Burkholderiales bacterium]
MSTQQTSQRLLRTQLLRWLLYPLLTILIIDSAVSFGLAGHFSKNAYDKALVEVGHELSLQIGKNASGIFLDLPEVARRLLLQDPQDKIFFELLDHRGQRIAGDPVQLSLVDMGGATLRVAETNIKRTEMAQQIIASVLLPQIILIIFVALLVPFGVSRGLFPLKALQRAITERSFRDRSPLNETAVPGEVIPLVASINLLLNRLDTVFSAQSRFVADAAHQLKTPVAALRAYVELLERSQDADERKNIILKLNDAVDRMSRLVSQLLALAQNDISEARPPEFERIDLNTLLLEISSNWVPQAINRNVDLGFEANTHPVVILGAPDRLRELFDNLIDNAIRYSKPRGSITVCILDAPSPSVSIRDDAPSIPEAERTLVFERFYRLLGSGEGSGLGLAIAKEIAVMHQATIHISADAQDGIGNNVFVSFPSVDTNSHRSL